VAVPVLPMTEDFEADWKGLRHYLRWLVPQGPTAIAMKRDPRARHAARARAAPDRAAGARGPARVPL